jgi:cellulose synthase/poly-beta-1,6-N-acetylglucosamine synthase-like glycosyltransferase
MFEIIFLLAVSLYFFQSFLLLIGSTKKFPKLTDDQLPTMSIVVAARNEEKNIIRCLESLNRLIYPDGKIEIIIINDNSTDSTLDKIEKFIIDKTRFRCLTTNKVIGNLKGKTNALANGLELAKGEIILTTDADCAVSQTWAKALASYYTKDVAMVCGFTSQETFSAFSGMQNLDFIYLLTVASGAMNFNVPLSCIGNNMSYRKTAYDEVGGYVNIPFSITEDFKLLKTIYGLNKYKIIYPLDPDAHVVSKPCENFNQLYWQRKRWGVGGLDSDLAGFLVMGIGFITQVCILLTPFFYSTAALYLVVFRFAIDFFFIYPAIKKLKLVNSLKYFFAFELYFIIYVIVLPFIVLPGRQVLWKGRNF